MQQVLQHNLNYARQRMKQQVDKKCSEHSFQVGDPVFIKLQPYVQQSVARRACHKLAFKYFGPYPVCRIINPTAYDIQLPADSKIHSVFHVPQLRKALLPGTTPSTALPVPTDVVAIPVKILDQRWKRSPTGRREQVLIQWSMAHDHDPTWEDKLELQHRFLAAVVWGQATTQEGGDVNNLATDMGLTSRQGRPKRLAQPNRRHVGP
jgi:hypothetical protein